jgi:hypothetical protein
MTSVTVVDSKQRRLTLAQNRIRLLASGARGPIGFDLLGDPADWTGKVPQFTGTGRQAVPVLPGSGADATLRADLLSNTGTANVKHKLSGTTGAVAQTLDAIVNEIITPTRWGAVGDGSTDCTAAFNAAIADANARLYGATLVIPAIGRFRLAGPLDPIGDHVAIVGFSNGGSLLSIEHDGPAFTWTGYGGGLENLRIEYPNDPDPAAVVALIKGGDGQNIRNIRVDNVAKLVQMGDSTHTGSVTHITDLMGNGFNCASPLVDVYAGAGLFMNNCTIFVAGVDNPDVDRVSTMSSATGRSLIKTNNKTFDTITISNGCLFERWWRILDFTNQNVGGSYNILNVIVDGSTVCDYISDDVYHLEAQTGGGGIVDVKLAGYASSWSGRAVNIDAHATIREVDVTEIYAPFSGKEGIRVAGPAWSDIRLHEPKLVGSNRLDGDYAGIRMQDSGTGKFSVVEAISGVDGAPGGTDWQAKIGISIGDDLNHYLVTDCQSDGTDGAYDFGTNSSPSTDRIVRNNINADYAGRKTGTAPYIPTTSGAYWINTTPFDVLFCASGSGVFSVLMDGHFVSKAAGGGSVLVEPGHTASWGGPGVLGTDADVEFFVKS